MVSHNTCITLLDYVLFYLIKLKIIVQDILSQFCRHAPTDLILLVFPPFPCDQTPSLNHAGLQSTTLLKRSTCFMYSFHHHPINQMFSAITIQVLPTSLRILINLWLGDTDRGWSMGEPSGRGGVHGQRRCPYDHWPESE